jgi:hypothetical protein
MKKPVYRINAEWHGDNPMPVNATLEERIAWHLAHAKFCGCRPMPPSIRAAIKKNKPGNIPTKS